MESPIHQQSRSFISVSAIPIVERNFQFRQQFRETPLSSAKSKASKLVPFYPYLDNFSANFKAVCPPSCTITPSGFSC
jgi:hypothetical protein